MIPFPRKNFFTRVVYEDIEKFNGFEHTYLPTRTFAMDCMCLFQSEYPPRFADYPLNRVPREILEKYNIQLYDCRGFGSLHRVSLEAFRYMAAVDPLKAWHARIRYLALRNCKACDHPFQIVGHENGCGMGDAEAIDKYSIQAYEDLEFNKVHCQRLDLVIHGLKVLHTTKASDLFALVKAEREKESAMPFDPISYVNPYEHSLFQRPLAIFDFIERCREYVSGGEIKDALEDCVSFLKTHNCSGCCDLDFQPNQLAHEHGCLRDYDILCRLFVPEGMKAFNIDGNPEHFVQQLIMRPGLYVDSDWEITAECPPKPANFCEQFGPRQA